MKLFAETLPYPTKVSALIIECLVNTAGDSSFRTSIELINHVLVRVAKLLFYLKKNRGKHTKRQILYPVAKERLVVAMVVMGT